MQVSRCYGVILGATIGKGRIVRIDAAEADGAPGVRLVMTHRNAPEQSPLDESVPEPIRPSVARALKRPHRAFRRAGGAGRGRRRSKRRAPPRSSDQRRVRRGTRRVRTRAHPERTYVPKTANVGLPTDSAFGDIDQAMREAPVTVDQVYTTPDHFAQPMEPPACLASWNGEDLTIRTSTQIVAAAREAVARHAAHSARARPCRCGLCRRRLRLETQDPRRDHPGRAGRARAKAAGQGGADEAADVQPAGPSTGDDPAGSPWLPHGTARSPALAHEVNMQGAARSEFVEQTATVVRSLYAAPNRLTRHRVTTLDLPIAEAVRGPGELPALLAVESAMDQLAHEARHGSDRAARAQRAGPRSGAGRAVLPAPHRRMHARRRCAVRLERSAAAARLRAATGDSSSATAWPPPIRMHFQGEDEGRGADGARWTRHREVRHDRHRHRNLHDRRAGCGGAPRRADRSGHGSARPGPIFHRPQAQAARGGRPTPVSRSIARAKR